MNAKAIDTKAAEKEMNDKSLESLEKKPKKKAVSKGDEKPNATNEKPNATNEKPNMTKKMREQIKQRNIISYNNKKTKILSFLQKSKTHDLPIINAMFGILLQRDDIKRRRDILLVSKNKLSKKIFSLSKQHTEIHNKISNLAFLIEKPQKMQEFFNALNKEENKILNMLRNVEKKITELKEKLEN